MTIWLISDTHFHHANILTFKGTNGELIRPGFGSIEEMNETIVSRWNSVVKPADHIYHLGDVSMRVSSSVCASLIARLNGLKRLVRGNHDKHQTTQYLKMGFKEIHGMRLLFDVWLTHGPIHPMSMGRALGNIHGHIHEKPSPPGPYLNVSVEAIDYTPISLEDARKRLMTRKESPDDHPSALSPAQ